MSQVIERIARAKINLALHIVGQREDGFHLIDSIVTFSQFGDRVRIETSKLSELISLKINGPFAVDLSNDENNLVFKAAELLACHTLNLQPVQITLEKNLPIASGIGGGSADAAATLLALSEFWKVDADLQKLASELGADVPMCLVSKPLRATGVGDETSILEGVNSLPILLVNPGVGVSTPEVFQALASKSNAPISTMDKGTFPSCIDLKSLRNDLQEPACNLEPMIGDVISALERTRPLLARMSGSGATCFAIYESDTSALAAREAIKREYPSWWCVATKTVAN